jgi:hypothetical protein
MALLPVKAESGSALESLYKENVKVLETGGGHGGPPLQAVCYDISGYSGSK